MKALWIAWTSTLLGGAALDQWTKHWAQTELEPRGMVTLVPGALELVYTENAGAFFGLGAALDGSLRRPLFVLAGLLAIALLAAFYGKTQPGQMRLRGALALLAAGALGNLVDRILRGSVIDFVHLHAGTFLRWATFNLADVWITGGLVLLSLELLRPNDRVAAVAGAGVASGPRERVL